MNIGKRYVLGYCLAFSILAPIRVTAAEPELTATLSVMGYGYKVKLAINGVDPGIEGGKSEGRRLFSNDSEMAKKASPQIRARNFILNRGTNEIAVEYVKIDPKSNDELEVKIEADGYPQPLFRLSTRSKASDKVSARLMLAPKAPADFKPVVFTDAR